MEGLVHEPRSAALWKRNPPGQEIVGENVGLYAVRPRGMTLIYPFFVVSSEEGTSEECHYEKEYR